jgi:hypothetical protein
MSKVITSMVAAMFLAGTGHPVQAQTAPAEGNNTQKKHGQQQFLFSISQKLSEYAHTLERLDRSKLLVQTAPFASLLPQFHPSSPGIVAFHNAPLVVVQYKRLMREWNRYQLQVFLESFQTAWEMLTPPIEVRADTELLLRDARPSLQVMGNLLLPNVDAGVETVNRLRQLFPSGRILATN